MTNFTERKTKLGSTLRPTSRWSSLSRGKSWKSKWAITRHAIQLTSSARLKWLKLVRPPMSKKARCPQVGQTFS
jgi:hypothetical protein